MKRIRSYVVFSTVALTIFLISGCNNDNSVKVGWLGNKIGSRMNASYRLFSGSEVGSIKAKAGETIVVDYEVTVAEGTLTIELQSNTGKILLQEEFVDYGCDSIEYRADRDERYRIVVKGYKTKGNYNLGWTIVR